MNREKAKRLQKMFLYFRWVCMALLLLVLFFYAYNVNAFSSDSLFKEEISVPNKWFLGILPYVSVYAFNTPPHSFNAATFFEPIEGNHVRLTIKEGYYRMNYIKEASVE